MSIHKITNFRRKAQNLLVCALVAGSVMVPPQRSHAIASVVSVTTPFVVFSIIGFPLGATLTYAGGKALLDNIDGTTHLSLSEKVGHFIILALGIITLDTDASGTGVPEIGAQAAEELGLAGYEEIYNRERPLLRAFLQSVDEVVDRSSGGPSQQEIDEMAKVYKTTFAPETQELVRAIFKKQLPTNL